MTFRRQEFDKFLNNHPRSEELWNRSVKVLAGGISHNIRNLGLPSINAFPIFMDSSNGVYLFDKDGIRYTDFWMGHFALILGHNHPEISKILNETIKSGWHFGTVTENQVKLAEEIIACNPSIERIRFCTSGTESTMYATRLARAFTNKQLVAKAKMGWHGPNDTLFYDVKAPFKGKESPGILAEDKAGIITYSPFEHDDTFNLIKKYKNDLAAVIIEPVIGGGGGFDIDKEFLRNLREITEKYGVLLIFDEVITGWRFNYGLYQNTIKVTPDLTTMGKIIGGGIAVASVGGRAEIIKLADPSHENRVWIGGGTFSANPLGMAAGLKTLEILKRSKADYERINTLGTKLRNDLNKFFQEESFKFLATGYQSIIFLHALKEHLESPKPDDIVTMKGKAEYEKESWLTLTLLNRNFSGMHGIGGLSLLHSKKQLEELRMAIEEVIPQILK